MSARDSETIEVWEPIPNFAQFALQTWYPVFQGHTVRTRFVPMSEAFFQYLVDCENGVVIDSRLFEPTSSSNFRVGIADSPYRSTLEELVGIIQSMGTVFPKLVFSSPQDASWITPTHTLACQSLSDLLSLLTSSHAFHFDFFECAKLCESLADTTFRTIALREFQPSLSTGSEFRVFVREHTVMAVSQRHCSERYDYLQFADRRTEIVETIWNFFESTVKDRFPVADFIMDVYLPSSTAVTILDFAPFHPVTQGLLFDLQSLKAAPVPGAAPFRRVPSAVQFRFIGPDDMPMNISQTFLAGVPSDLKSISDEQQEALRLLAEQYEAALGDEEDDEHET